MIKVASTDVVRVKDVMSTNVLTVPFSATLAQAALLLHDARVGGAPVVDARGRVLGMLSQTDLADPRHAGAPDAPVADAMTRVVFGVREEDALKWAIRLMVDEHVHRVAVTDASGHLVGIVTAMDVLRLIAPEKRTDLGFEYVDLSTNRG
jgi:IMP dehydrogenase